jgi:RimJ/RimL family protein N-acetyltransferase
MELRTHTVTLRSDRLVLRPMTEADWPTLLRWNNDPEVLYFSEGDDVTSRSLEDIQGIYRSVSQNAFCFMAELGVAPVGESSPIGECWLQRMNLECILRRFPDQDCRRIDLSIGEKALWGQGLRTEMIRLLSGFAFEQERADRVFGCDIADYNPRSLKAFLRAGYQIDAQLPQPPGSKAKYVADVCLTRDRYLDMAVNASR